MLALLLVQVDVLIGLHAFRAGQYLTPLCSEFDLPLILILGQPRRVQWLMQRVSKSKKGGAMCAHSPPFLCCCVVFVF